MLKETLKPLARLLVVNGAVSYNRDARCNNVIRLKKKVVSEFPELVTAKFVQYQLEFHRTFEALEKRIKELKTKKKAMPLLLFLYKND